MKYLIIGAGGTGGAIGGFLARAGKDVTFIDKGVHLEKIKTSGLYLETPNGEYMISAPAYSTSEYSDVPDVIFVCVKGYSLDEVLPFIEKLKSKIQTQEKQQNLHHQQVHLGHQLDLHY